MTIGEIAKRAGVSPAAVSRYFNNGYVSEQKRAAIGKVVEETGYRPSAQAQTLRTRKTKLIGVIVPRIDSEPIGRIVSGILSVLEQSGYRMLLADTQNDPGRELEYLGVFGEKQVDGVILAATIFTPGHIKQLKAMTIPLAIVGQRLDGCYCVYHDDYRSMYDMTRWVIGQGCRRLAFMRALQEDQAAGRERYRGYCEALLEAGLSERAACCVTADFTVESGFQKARELFDICPDAEAVLCAADNMAIGVLQYLKEQKGGSAGRILVTGHGDSALMRVMTPPAPTVRYYYEDSGMLAARMVLDLVDKKEGVAREIRLGYQLVTGPVTTK